MAWRLGMIGTGTDYIRRITKTLTGAKIVAVTDVNAEQVVQKPWKSHIVRDRTGKG